MHCEFVRPSTSTNKLFALCVLVPTTVPQQYPVPVMYILVVGLGVYKKHVHCRTSHKGLRTSTSHKTNNVTERTPGQAAVDEASMKA